MKSSGRGTAARSSARRGGGDPVKLTNSIEGQRTVYDNDLRTIEAHNVTNRVLSDYFRCPQNLIPFLPARRLSERPSYFRFGEDTLCYGRLSPNADPSSPGEPYNALEDIQMDAGGIQLPFDPWEVVENLHRERYSAHFREEGRILNDVLRKVYYFVRPLLGVSARRHLQRMRLRGWREISFPAWPVDTTVERVHQKLLALTMRAQGLERMPFIWFWPEGFRSCAIMTHDVECSRGRDFCAKLMDLDESYGFYSAFQLVPENRYSIPKSFLHNIASRGFEVNVHDLKHDGRLYANCVEFKRRAKSINDYARAFGAEGFRSGSLYRNADWFGAFEFSYDMSLPNVAHLDPQRGGCCTVMPYFIGKIVELPLTTTQDYTLFHILDDYSIDLWNEQIALILANNGLINFLIHPDYIMESKALDNYKALLGLLARLRSDGSLWTALPRDVARWWRDRSEMELVFERGQWRVEGPSKERARVAYAELVGDEVAYSFVDCKESSRV